MCFPQLCLFIVFYDGPVEKHYLTVSIYELCFTYSVHSYFEVEVRETCLFPNTISFCGKKRLPDKQDNDL